MKGFFHLLWVPFAYIFAPKWLGRRALHGILVQMGYGGGLIPKDAMNEIADRAYRIHSASGISLGFWEKMEDLFLTMQTYAEQVVAVISEKDRASNFLASCHDTQEILDKHGVKTPPILVDQYNRRKQ